MQEFPMRAYSDFGTPVLRRSVDSNFLGNCLCSIVFSLLSNKEFLSV
jgi:hypothetical protein